MKLVPDASYARAGRSSARDVGRTAVEGYLGSTIWVQMNDGGSITGGDRDNSFTLRFEAELDALAERLGKAKLSSFYDYGALEAEFEDDLDIETGSSSWFDAGAGLDTVSALLDELLRAAPSGPPHGIPGDVTPRVIDELEYCRGLLATARDAGADFRLLIVS